MVDVPEPTVYVWVRAWRERGYPGVCHPTETGGEPGRPPSLDDGDLAVLEALLEERPFWQTREVRALIREHFGVEISESQVARILRGKLGMHFGKPYPRDSRRPTDAKSQLEERLITAYERLRAQGLSDPECRRARDTFWDVQVAKTTALGDSLGARIRPAVAAVPDSPLVRRARQRPQMA